MTALFYLAFLFSGIILIGVLLTALHDLVEQDVARRRARRTAASAIVRVSLPRTAAPERPDIITVRLAPSSRAAPEPQDYPHAA
jgi:hypothetical protein